MARGAAAAVEDRKYNDFNPRAHAISITRRIGRITDDIVSVVDDKLDSLTA